MSKLNKNEVVIEMDVDDTIILHDIDAYPSLPRITLNYYGMPMVVVPHLKHIELLKSYKKRGFFVRVHSNNGWKHVDEVLKKLDLWDFVDEGETKASKHVDDTKENFRQHVFLPMKKG